MPLRVKRAVTNFTPDRVGFVDKGREPGRGINLFRALRRIFRAAAGAQGLAGAVVDRVGRA